MKSHKKKALLIDTDDVLLDYAQGVTKFAKSQYGLDPVSEVISYDLEKSFNISSVMVEHLLNHFNTNSYKFGLIPVIDSYVKIAMIQLRRNYPDVDLIVVTKCGTLSLTVALRKVNLANEFGDGTFDDIYFLEPSESKFQVFEKLKKRYDIVAVVDDYIGNIKDAQRLNLNTIVYERNHNVHFKDDPKYTFFSNWEDIYKHIEKLINGA